MDNRNFGVATLTPAKGSRSPVRRPLLSQHTKVRYAMWWHGHGSTDGEAGGGAATSAHMWCWERQLVSVYFVVMTILVSPALLHLDLFHVQSAHVLTRFPNRDQAALAE